MVPRLNPHTIYRQKEKESLKAKIPLKNGSKTLHTHTMPLYTSFTKYTLLLITYLAHFAKPSENKTRSAKLEPLAKIELLLEYQTPLGYNFYKPIPSISNRINPVLYSLMKDKYRLVIANSTKNELYGKDLPPKFEIFPILNHDQKFLIHYNEPSVLQTAYGEGAGHQNYGTRVLDFNVDPPAERQLGSRNGLSGKNENTLFDFKKVDFVSNGYILGTVYEYHELEEIRLKANPQSDPNQGGSSDSKSETSSQKPSENSQRFYDIDNLDNSEIFNWNIIYKNQTVLANEQRKVIYDVQNDRLLRWNLKIRKNAILGPKNCNFVQLVNSFICKQKNGLTNAYSYSIYPFNNQHRYLIIPFDKKKEPEEKYLNFHSPKAFDYLNDTIVGCFVDLTHLYCEFYRFSDNSSSIFAVNGVKPYKLLGGFENSYMVLPEVQTVVVSLETKELAFYDLSNSGKLLQKFKFRSESDKNGSNGESRLKNLFNPTFNPSAFQMTWQVDWSHMIALKLQPRLRIEGCNVNLDYSTGKCLKCDPGYQFDNLHLNDPGFNFGLPTDVYSENQKKKRSPISRLKCIQISQKSGDNQNLKAKNEFLSSEDFNLYRRKTYLEDSFRVTFNKKIHLDAFNQTGQLKMSSFSHPEIVNFTKMETTSIKEGQNQTLLLRLVSKRDRERSEVFIQAKSPSKSSKNTHRFLAPNHKILILPARLVERLSCLKYLLKFCFYCLNLFFMVIKIYFLIRPFFVSLRKNMDKMRLLNLIQFAQLICLLTYLPIYMFGWIDNILYNFNKIIGLKMFFSFDSSYFQIPFPKKALSNTKFTEYNENGSLMRRLALEVIVYGALLILSISWTIVKWFLQKYFKIMDESLDLEKYTNSQLKRKIFHIGSYLSSLRLTVLYLNFIPIVYFSIVTIQAYFSLNNSEFSLTKTEKRNAKWSFCVALVTPLIGLIDLLISYHSPHFEPLVKVEIDGRNIQNGEGVERSSIKQLRDSKNGVDEVKVNVNHSIMSKKAKPSIMAQLFPRSVCSFYIHTTKIFKLFPDDQNSLSFVPIKVAAFFQFIFYPLIAVLLGFNQSKNMRVLFFLTVLLVSVHLVMRIILALVRGYSSSFETFFQISSSFLYFSILVVILVYQNFNDYFSLDIGSLRSIIIMSYVVYAAYFLIWLIVTLNMVKLVFSGLTRGLFWELKPRVVGELLDEKHKYGRLTQNDTHFVETREEKTVRNAITNMDKLQFWRFVRSQNGAFRFSENNPGTVEQIGKGVRILPNRPSNGEQMRENCLGSTGKLKEIYTQARLDEFNQKKFDIDDYLRSKRESQINSQSNIIQDNIMGVSLSPQTQSPQKVSVLRVKYPRHDEGNVEEMYEDEELTTSVRQQLNSLHFPNSQMNTKNGDEGKVTDQNFFKPERKLNLNIDSINTNILRINEGKQPSCKSSNAVSPRTEGAKSLQRLLQGINNSDEEFYPVDQTQREDKENCQPPNQDGELGGFMGRLGSKGQAIKILKNVGKLGIEMNKNSRKHLGDGRGIHLKSVDNKSPHISAAKDRSLFKDMDYEYKLRGDSEVRKLDLRPFRVGNKKNESKKEKQMQAQKIQKMFEGEMGQYLNKANGKNSSRLKQNIWEFQLKV